MEADGNIEKEKEKRKNARRRGEVHVGNGKGCDHVRIGIYTGTGTSHSWLWFVDVFERFGFYNLTFLREKDINENGLHTVDVLAMSGGDTFAVAKALGRKGADNLECFIRNGGLYIGSCAGAYLTMNSSQRYLKQFNYMAVKIANLTKILPKAMSVSKKFCTPYGCSFVFHPVREDVIVRTNGVEPFAGAGSLVAPLYGGPSMLVSDSMEVLAYYEEFTNKTVFLVDKEIARNTVIGNVAVVRGKMGKGHLYLFGPHFEHPHYPMANKLVNDVINFEVKAPVQASRGLENNINEIKGAGAKELIRNLKRELSNSRIVSSGLEMIPVHWLIGNKIYEPAKIRVFLESMWKRIRIIKEWDELIVKNRHDRSIVRLASDITMLLRLIRKYVNQGLNTEDLAGQLFGKLNILSTMFLDIYFKSKLHIGGVKREL